MLSEESEEIRVYLTTQSPLSPVYISHLQAENTPLSKTYVQELESVLEYDLKHGGKAKLTAQTPATETAIWASDLRSAFNPRLWKEKGIAFVIRPEISGKTLNVHVLDVQKGSLKQIEGISLSGDMSQDRRHLHKLADALQKTLFDTEGVAHSRILYSVQVKNTQQKEGDGAWLAEIWECDWDGANARPVTQDKSYNVSPVFSSTQKAADTFLYVSYQLSQPKVYLGTLSKPTRKRFLTLKGNQLLPAISPQRDKVAFISDAAGRPDLFLQMLSPDGKELDKPHQLFSFPRSTQASPTFSPDGKQIAFVSDKDGRPRIYVISSTPQRRRGKTTLLTKKNPESSCPNWSPDGTKLAFSAKTNGTRQIWIYDFETQEEKQLTFGPGNKENPFWAPDSLHLVFNSTDQDSSELFVVNLNQPAAVQITRGPGKKHYPSWGKRIP